MKPILANRLCAHFKIFGVCGHACNLVAKKELGFVHATQSSAFFQIYHRIIPAHRNLSKAIHHF
jgi:hypothetical protein